MRTFERIWKYVQTFRKDGQLSWYRGPQLKWSSLWSDRYFASRAHFNELVDFIASRMYFKELMDPERGLWERSNFKEVPQLLKSNRISLAYGLTSIKTKLLWIKVALFSSYIEEYVDFVPFSDALGDITAFGPFGSAFEGHGSPPPVNRYMCIPPEFKRRCLNRLFPKSACKSPPT